MYGQTEPDLSTALSVLQPYNSDELKKLLNEDGQLDDMIKDLQLVKNLEVEKEMLMVSNKSLAEFNLSREPRLRSARQRLIDSYKHASQDFAEVEEKKQQLDDLSRQVSLDTTLAILQTSAAQTEEETEKIAEKFLEGSIDVESFLEDFLPQRKLAHLRRVKVDKLSELLIRNRTQPPPPTVAPSWSSPYGLPTMQMPLPSYNPAV